MKQSLQTFGLSLFIVLAFLTIGIGFLFGITNPVPWIMIAILVTLPFIHKQIVARRYLAWNERLATGITAIDNDHRKLVGLINNLQTAVYYPTGEAFERQAIHELVEYTLYHFSREEKWMEQAGYPELDSHKQEHRQMVAKVEEFMSAYEQDREKTVEEMLAFLKSWLFNHIAISDQQYVPFMKAKGIDGEEQEVTAA